MDSFHQRPKIIAKPNLTHAGQSQLAPSGKQTVKPDPHRRKRYFRQPALNEEPLVQTRLAPISFKQSHWNSGSYVSSSFYIQSLRSSEPEDCPPKAPRTIKELLKLRQPQQTSQSDTAKPDKFKRELNRIVSIHESKSQQSLLALAPDSDSDNCSLNPTSTPTQRRKEYPKNPRGLLSPLEANKDCYIFVTKDSKDENRPGLSQELSTCGWRIQSGVLFLSSTIRHIWNSSGTFYLCKLHLRPKLKAI
jgi:hypothetical protein